MNEDNIIFKVEKHDDGMSVEVHCENLDEVVNVTRAIASVAKADDVFGMYLLMSLKYYFSEEGKKELEQNSVEMPDFNKLLKDTN